MYATFVSDRFTLANTDKRTKSTVIRNGGGGKFLHVVRDKRVIYEKLK